MPDKQTVDRLVENGMKVLERGLKTDTPPPPPTAKIGDLEWKPAPAQADSLKREMNEFIARSMMDAFRTLHGPHVSFRRRRWVPWPILTIGTFVYLHELLPLLGTITPLDFFQLTVVVLVPTLFLTLLVMALA